MSVIPSDPKTITPAQAALEALAETREVSLNMRTATDRLLEIVQLQQTPPEMHTIVINNNNDGRYVHTSKSRWEAKSIGVINPGTVPVFLGIGGVSATPGSRALSVAPLSMLVLPVRVYDLELGCDPAVLLANTAVVYMFRFNAVQPLNVQLLT